MYQCLILYALVVSYMRDLYDLYTKRQVYEPCCVRNVVHPAAFTGVKIFYEMPVLTEIKSAS